MHRILQGRGPGPLAVGWGLAVAGCAPHSWFVNQTAELEVASVDDAPRIVMLKSRAEVCDKFTPGTERNNSA